MKKVFILYIVSVLNLCAQGFGNTTISDPISGGMGNTYTSNVAGAYAIGKNPANILLGRGSAIEIATLLPIPNASFFAGTDFLTLDEFNYFFGGVVNDQGNKVARLLTEDDKSRLKGLFDQGGIVSGAASVTLFNIVVKLSRSVGAFGFSINDNAGSVFDFPKGVIELALDGNPVGTTYDFGGSQLSMAWYRDYTFTYARDFRDLFSGFRNFYIGASLRFIQGFSMIHTDHVSTTFETGTNNEIITLGDVLGYAAFSPDFGVDYDFDSTSVKQENDFTVFPEAAGSGVGFDFGITANLSDKITLAMAITGLGSITWDKNVAEYSSDVSLVFDDLTDEAVRDSLLDSITGEGRFVDEVSTELPSAFRLGFSINIDRYFSKNEFPGKLLLALDYNQGLNNTAMSTTKPRVSLGAEWKPSDMFPIRTGFSFGGRNGFAWSFGTGLDLGSFEFNISAYSFSGWFAANQAEKLAVSLGSKIKL